MHVLTRATVVVGAGVLVAWLALRARAPHAADARAGNDAAARGSVAFDAKKLARKHLLPASLPSLDQIALEQIPSVTFADPKREGEQEVFTKARAYAIDGFHTFVKNNSVTPVQERMLMALIADVESDIHEAKLVATDLRHGPIKIARATYDKLGPQKTLDLVYEEAERRAKDAQDLDDSSRDAIQGDFDTRAQAILTPDQFQAWHGYDLRSVITLEADGPFTEPQE